MTRRDFLKAFGAGVASLGLNLSNSTNVLAAPPSKLIARRGKDTFKIDIYDKKGYMALKYLMRDIKDGVEGFPHFFLVERMAWVQSYFALYKKFEVFNITSGLRTPRTNRAIEGAAQRSAHLPNKDMVFFAVDFRLGNISASEIADVSKALASYSGFGGTGLYVGRNFIHMDVMRKRQWKGK